MARGRDAHLSGADQATRGLDAFGGAVDAAANAGDFAILNDVDAARVGGAGKAPGHCVMARGAAAALQRAAKDRVTHRADVERRAVFLSLLRAHPFIVEAVKSGGGDRAGWNFHVVYL